MFIGDWRVKSAKKKQQRKKSKNMNENKLKSCRKILTCRSRYSEFLSSRLCCSFLFVCLLIHLSEF